MQKNHSLYDNEQEKLKKVEGKLCFVDFIH